MAMRVTILPAPLLGNLLPLAAARESAGFSLRAQPTSRVGVQRAASPIDRLRQWASGAALFFTGRVSFSRAKFLPGKFRVLSFYLLTEISDPAKEVEAHKTWCKAHSLTGRVWISEKGINAHVCGTSADCKSYANFAALRLVPGQRLRCKLDGATERVVETLRVKVKELVTLGQEQENAFDLQHRGEDLEPQEWAKRLEELAHRRSGRLLDIRSPYEWDVGHFEGAERPECETFAEMTPETLGLSDANKEEPVMIYCTGGIRCEFVGAMLKKEGFQDVCKLRGGVQHYGNSLGARHWDGRLFVFDRRDSIAVGKYDEASVVGRCHVCGKPCEDVWNCHNYECNRTMVACEQCMQSMKGCCCADCQASSSIRPFEADRRRGRGPGRFLPATEVETQARQRLAEMREKSRANSVQTVNRKLLGHTAGIFSPFPLEFTGRAKRM